MAKWDISDAGTESCEKCGAEYKVTTQKLPMRDKDKFYCSCGHLIREWKGTTSYSYELIEKQSKTE